MITQISGKLLEKTPTHVVIDCNGIGYIVHISLQTFSLIDGELCKLYTHLSIKEDSHTLYGFYDQNERHLFRNLISVSGVGPSTAQVILSTYNSSEIVSYITSADVSAIQHVKGIGAKTAQRVIVDLKGKSMIVESSVENITEKSNTIHFDALSALVSLGFDKRAAEKALNKANVENATLESLIKEALKVL
jgi:Holliday junction DNA helicase RuvA